MYLTVRSYHVTYPFQSESTYYICLNFKELFAQNRPDIPSLCDCNETRTHKNLIRKWTLNHLVKPTKWWDWVVSTYLYVAFDCLFLSCPQAFQTESPLYIYLNVKKPLARKRHDI